MEKEYERLDRIIGSGAVGPAKMTQVSAPKEPRWLAICGFGPLRDARVGMSALALAVWYL